MYIIKHNENGGTIVENCTEDALNKYNMHLKSYQAHKTVWGLMTTKMRQIFGQIVAADWHSAPKRNPYSRVQYVRYIYYVYRERIMDVQKRGSLWRSNYEIYDFTTLELTQIWYNRLYEVIYQY